MPLNLNLRCANGSMFQYLYLSLKTSALTPSVAKLQGNQSLGRPRHGSVWMVWIKLVQGWVQLQAFVDTITNFWVPMTQWLLPSSPECIPDQTMRKESVPPVFELSCKPTPPTIINHTGAHPCRRHSKVSPWLNCVNQQRLSNVGSQQTVTFQSINLRPDVEVVTAECLVGQK
jgi:hypothetical protein